MVSHGPEPTTRYERALQEGNLGKKQRQKYEMKLARKQEREVCGHVSQGRCIVLVNLTCTQQMEAAREEQRRREAAKREHAEKQAELERYVCVCVPSTVQGC